MTTMGISGSPMFCRYRWGIDKVSVNYWLTIDEPATISTNVHVRLVSVDILAAAMLFSVNVHILTCRSTLNGNWSKCQPIHIQYISQVLADCRLIPISTHTMHDLFTFYFWWQNSTCNIFLFILTNAIIKFCILGERAKEKEKDKHSSTSSVSSKSSISSAGTTNGGSNQNSKTEPTWVHDIFEGILTNETRCLCCETVSQPWKISCHILS